MSGAEQTTPKVVLHPKLRRDAERLLREPGLTRETIKAIRRDLHMDPPRPERPLLPICQGKPDAG
jgi:hypothetical protein